MKEINDKKVRYFYGKLVFTLTRSVCGDYKLSEVYREKLYHYLMSIENEIFTNKLQEIVKRFLALTSYKNWTYFTYYMKLLPYEARLTTDIISPNFDLTEGQKAILRSLITLFSTFKEAEKVKLKQDMRDKGITSIKEYFKRKKQ